MLLELLDTRPLETEDRDPLGLSIAARLDRVLVPLLASALTLDTDVERNLPPLV